MIKITINDSFCEWEFFLDGADGYSIQDLIDIITVHTRAKVFEERLLSPHKEEQYKTNILS